MRHNIFESLKVSTERNTRKNEDKAIEAMKNVHLEFRLDTR